MVFAVAEEVLEAELVLDGEEQGPVRADERAERSQERLRRGLSPAGHVLVHPDAQHQVEAGGILEGAHVSTGHLDVRQSRTARGGGPRTGQGAFEGQHLGPALSQVAGEGAGARPHVEHPQTRAQGERPQQVGPQAGEVVARGPVGNVCSELVGRGRAIHSLTEHAQHLVLGPVRIGHGVPEQAHATLRSAHLPVGGS